jgi:hypothetical protein
MTEVELTHGSLMPKITMTVALCWSLMFSWQKRYDDDKKMNSSTKMLRTRIASRLLTCDTMSDYGKPEIHSPAYIVAADQRSMSVCEIGLRTTRSPGSSSRYHPYDDET